MDWNGERRAHPRVAASGAVEISIDDPVPTMIRAELIEASAGGFRAVHDSSLLEPGLEVNYKAPFSAGQARIVWTHIFEGRRVSGFHIAP